MSVELSDCRLIGQDTEISSACASSKYVFNGCDMNTCLPVITVNIFCVGIYLLPVTPICQ